MFNIRSFLELLQFNTDEPHFDALSFGRKFAIDFILQAQYYSLPLKKHSYNLIQPAHNQSKSVL